MTNNPTVPGCDRAGQSILLYNEACRFNFKINKFNMKKNNIKKNLKQGTGQYIAETYAEDQEFKQVLVDLKDMVDPKNDGSVYLGLVLDMCGYISHTEDLDLNQSDREWLDELYDIARKAYDDIVDYIDEKI